MTSLEEMRRELRERYEKLYHRRIPKMEKKAQSSPIMVTDEWETEASKIPEKCCENFCITKKHVRKGDIWTMKEDERGVFGYEDVLFTRPSTITGLEERESPRAQPILWMSDSPREYYSMWELVARTKPKRVLVGGLGLGILANLLSKRLDIDEVVVVEKSKCVIDMVKSHVHPKVKIIHGDFFKTASELSRKGEKYDTVILDIYTGKEDVEDVKIDVETIEDTFPESKVLAWKFQPELEEDILYFLMRRETLKGLE